MESDRSQENFKINALRGKSRARWRRGTKPSRGQNRNVREGNEVKMPLASSNKSLTQTDINLSEEKFRQTGRSEEGQTPRYSNYSGSKLPSMSQFFPFSVATVIPSLPLALGWYQGGSSNPRHDDIRERKRGYKDPGFPWQLRWASWVGLKGQPSQLPGKVFPEDFRPGLFYRMNRSFSGL